MEMVHKNNSAGNENDGKEEKVRLKKQLGLLEGVAIILGIIFGSGIFVSPQGVIQEVGSVGLSLIIWICCGALSTIGAICYAELGTCIPKSGGDYVYIHEAFGEMPSFLYLWAANIIFVPTTNAIMSLTFAKYILKPFFETCPLPDGSTQIIAALTICLLTFINSFNVKETSRMQNVIMFAKISALVLIIIVGLYWLGIGHTENYNNIFENTSKNPGKFAVAFYSGIFSYSGWNYLNFMTEELKNPYVNLPRAIYISLPLVTLIYVLANVAYLAVLDPITMSASPAIAVTLSNKTMGMMSWIMPVLVAISAFGGLSVHIMTSSRMCFVGAKNGHLPSILSHLNINKLTPMPALVFLCILSLVMLCTDNISALITYCSIVESFFIMLSVSGVLWMRYSRPNMKRPIKVSIWIPIFFVGVCLFLVIVPCIYEPKKVLAGALITLSGIPVYFVGIAWKNKPIWFQNMNVNITRTVQKLFVSGKEELNDDDEEE